MALPCTEGIEITKLLLQYGANPNLRDTFPPSSMTVEGGGNNRALGENAEGMFLIACTQTDALDALA